MDRPAYPNALILAHPAMSAAEAIQVARDTGMDLAHNPETGNFRLAPKPAAAQAPGSSGAGLRPVSRPASAAGPLEAA